MLINLFYLLSICCFILGLKFLSSPRTARRGNLLSMAGMFIAVVVTLFEKQIVDYTYIVAGIIIGGLIGAVAARRVKMTAMPQMVAVFNAFGGAASALVVYAQFIRFPGFTDPATTVTIVLSLFIGMLTFVGSMMAFGKLQGLVPGAPVVFPGHKILNALLHLFVLGAGIFFVLDPTNHGLAVLAVIVLVSGIVGITMVLPIGGADMPVVIALLNSYSGLAAAASGFVINNYVLIVSGALVGASGLILTDLMCKAMNRSLTNVLFGAVGHEAGPVAGTAMRNVTRYTPLDAAMML